MRRRWPQLSFGHTGRMSLCEPADHWTGVHPAIAERRSPASFDPAAQVGANAIDSLLEAARLAPSAGNSQPWSFIVGRRGDRVHARVVEHLASSSARWAPDASVIVVNLAHVLVEGTEWEYSEFSRYDLGQAVAYMTLQGRALGLDAHQFRAFDRESVAREFSVPPEWEVTSMTAFGYAIDSPSAIDRDSLRPRRTREDLVWARD